MSTRKERILGIDLGTTNSCVSVVEFGKTVVIPNSEGARTTPSIVHIEHGGVRVVGSRAKKRAVKYPERTIHSIKRHMGTNHRVNIDGFAYSPEQMASFILQKLKAQAEEYLMEPVSKAVVTVPAYFNDVQRMATRHAGSLAGLEVVRIVNEPTACSLAYGFHKMGPEEQCNIIVFDFGGGTFDVSILNISAGVVQVKATNGNNRLGGDDFDLRLAMHFNEEFRKQYGVDASQDLVARQRMLEAAEQAKIELSSTRFSHVSLPFLAVAHGEPRNLELDVSVDDFNRVTEHLLRSTAFPIETALKDAKMRPEQIDKVVLCGGTTRIPAIQQYIRRLFNKEPSKTINPDEAVSIGAALQGAVIAGEIEDLHLKDVIAISVNVEIEDGKVLRIVEKNTSIPHTYTHKFLTSMDNQRSIDVHVLQGEGQTVMGNISLANFTIDGLAPAPAGQQGMDVEFHIDADCIIQCSFKQGANQLKKALFKRSSGIDQEEVERLLAQEKTALGIDSLESPPPEKGSSGVDAKAASAGIAAGARDSAGIHHSTTKSGSGFLARIIEFVQGFLQGRNGRS